MVQKCVYKGGRAVLVSVVFSLVSLMGAQAQTDDMGATELLGEADLLLKTERYDAAIPYMMAYLKKFGDNTDFRVVSMAQDVRFKLGSVMVYQKKIAEAIPFFEQYVSYRPAPKWHEAMKLLSTSLLESEQYEVCVTRTVEALAGPTNEINPVVVSYNEEDEDEKDSGIKYDEFGEVIQEGDVAAEELDPSGYNRADMVILNTTLAEAYDALKRYEESISPYLYVAEHETIGIRRGYAIMKAIEAMVELQKFDELTRLIPPLYQTDARFDIRVNLALLKAASSLFEAKQYDDALPLYRMILPRDKLIEYQTKRIKRLQYDAGIITINQLTKEEIVELGIEVTLMGKKTDVVTEEFWRERGEDPNIDKPQELIDLELLIETLINIPPYEKDVVYRNAYLYSEVDRPWEAYRLFDGLYEEDPDDIIAQRSFYEAMRLMLDELDGGEEAEQRCYEYLGKYKEDITPRQIAYLLTGYYQKNEKMASVKELLPYLEGFIPSESQIIRRYEAELYYMQAIADLVMLEYAKAKASFELVLNKYPGSHQEDNATYWHAMTLMFLQKYEEAYPEFEAYLEKFPKGEWLASANFQLGTCLFGMEDYNKAKERFTIVIENYPDSPPYPDACSMRADILASEDFLEEAIVDYKNAIAAANAAAEENRERAIKQSGYATFQLANLYYEWGKYPLVIGIATDYRDFYGDDANVSKCVYWIGRTRVAQNRVDEAVQSYLDAITKYGTDLAQDGVDSMIAELVAIAQRQLKPEERVQMNKQVMALLGATDNLTLQLRLRALLAQMSGTEIELGKTLISELDDLSAAAPPVLAAISSASFELEDYSRAGEILNVFQTQFDDSEFIRPVYKLRAFDLRKQGDLDAALKIIDDTQARYGTDNDVAWAQLMKGDVLLKKNQMDDARKTLLDVFNVVEWRGEPYAEATYRLGQVEEAAGDPRAAFGWYQRAYFQYKGYAKGFWAAEAYLASARCLEQMRLPNEMRNTYRAMLFDKYVRDLPQAAVAREALGPEEVMEIIGLISSGTKTNITVTLDEVEAGQ